MSTAPGPSRPFPTLPTVAYSVHWAARDGEPESYDYPYVSADEALRVAAIYENATAVTAPITYGEWTPISSSPVADLTDDEGDETR